MGASGQNLNQIASGHPEMCKIFKFAIVQNFQICGRLIREEQISLEILGCKAEDSDQFPLPIP